jgi:hypothetical protein
MCVERFGILGVAEAPAAENLAATKANIVRSLPLRDLLTAAWRDLDRQAKAVRINQQALTAPLS